MNIINRKIALYIFSSIVPIWILFSCNKNKITEIENIKIFYIGERDKSYPCVELSVYKGDQEDIFIYQETIDKNLMKRISFLYNNIISERQILGNKYLKIEITTNSEKKCIELNKHDSKNFLSKIILLLNKRNMSYFYLNSMYRTLSKK